MVDCTAYHSAHNKCDRPTHDNLKSVYQFLFRNVYMLRLGQWPTVKVELGHTIVACVLGIRNNTQVSQFSTVGLSD